MLYTTLQRLRDNDACSRGYNLIAEHIGLTGDTIHEGNPNWVAGDNDNKIPLEMILDNNGLNDCIWALRAADGGKEIAQEFAIRVAKKVYTEPKWNLWADKWLDGSNRSSAAAYAAAAYAAAADAAAYAAAAAAYAAAAAVYAAAAAAAAYAAAAAAAAADAAARKKMHLENIELLRSLIK